MPSFHNHPAQFRSFTRPTSLNLGLAPVVATREEEIENFELDSPGIDFGEESAALIDLVFSSVSPPTGESSADLDSTDEMENS
jgi:hypothetical protein